MAEMISLARPYAKAAFNHAREAGDVALWSEALATLSAVVENEKVATALHSPALPASEKAEQLIALYGKLSDSLQNFLHVLAEYKRLSLLPWVYELFLRYQAEFEKTLNVEIVSAFALSGDAESKLSAALTARFAREVQVQSSVDPALLGGVVIHAGDTVIDSSARGVLHKMAAAMNA